MAAGATTRLMAMFGPLMFPRPGRHTVTASGSGTMLMAGPGWITIPGAGRHSITVPGIGALVSAGHGSRDRASGTTGIGPHSSVSLDLAEVLGSALASA